MIGAKGNRVHLFRPKFVLAALQPPQDRLLSKLGEQPWGFPQNCWPVCPMRMSRAKASEESIYFKQKPPLKARKLMFEVAEPYAVIEGIADSWFEPKRWQLAVVI